MGPIERDLRQVERSTAGGGKSFYIRGGANFQQMSELEGMKTAYKVTISILSDQWLLWGKNLRSVSIFLGS